MTTREYFRAGEGDVAGTGLIAFGAIMLGLAGLWNLLEGLFAIGGSRVYVGETVFVFSDLKTWGWIMTVLGVLQLVAALAVVGGSELARWFAVAVVSINILGQLFFFPANPWWALVMFMVDVVIIYALVAYGGKRLRQNPT